MIYLTFEFGGSKGDHTLKTLIFNGSPRKKGDTVSLINRMTEHIQGDYKIVNAYNSEISPCMDCRYCWGNRGCAIQDEMQIIYPYIQECDNILIASPIYFSELTGKLLDVGSRLQSYFCARFFRNEDCISKAKRGAVVLVGGGDGNMEKAYDTACTLLRLMNCTELYPLVSCHDTNRKAAIENREVFCRLQDLSTFFMTENRTSSGI